MLSDATKRVVQKLYDLNILPKNVDDIEAFKEELGYVIQGTYFGEEPHPMVGLEMGKTYERVEDMSPSGKLQLLVEEDGDVIVSVHGDDATSTIQFCTPGTGGGRSPRTRHALLTLCHAIQRDNEERR